MTKLMANWLMKTPEEFIYSVNNDRDVKDAMLNIF